MNTLPTSSENLTAIYKPEQRLTQEMVTLRFVNQAIKPITNAKESVEFTKNGKCYIPTIRRVVSELGKRTMENLVKTELIKLNIALNLQRPMTELFIEEVAPLIVQYLIEENYLENEGYEFTIADLRIVFDNAKLGKYQSSFYGGVGCNDITRWIQEYRIEKNHYACTALINNLK